MSNPKLNIEEYFKYHPPTTELRKQQHNQINGLALDFARYIDENVQDEDCKKMALFAIQQARMFANQGVTVDEIHRTTENLFG
jgi:hypothetical protein